MSRSAGRRPYAVPRTLRSAAPPTGRTNESADPAVAGLRWLRLAASVLGPLTLATALLYYYGYVTTYAQYHYFGVEVDLLDYSTADYVLRSPASLFAPLLVLLALVGAAYWAHVTLTRWDLPRTHPRVATVVFRVTLVIGVLLFLRGGLGIVDGNVSADETIGTTPATLGLGTLLVLYSFRLAPAPRRGPGGESASDSSSTVAWAIGWCFVVASLFWLVNSFASAYGRGLGQDVQAGLVDQPDVVLHTRSELAVEAEGVTDLGVLCASRTDSKDYPFRYNNLRLLATSHDSYFLVPLTWTEQRGIVIVVKKAESSIQLMDWPGRAPCDT